MSAEATTNHLNLCTDFTPLETVAHMVIGWCLPVPVMIRLCIKNNRCDFQVVPPGLCYRAVGELMSVVAYR